ncbi:MAG: hypothetical protein COB50_00375 [Thiotrichales bacterium]|nr:MAG: hypothetical protein COB50_00375 [Thiotrichales bacterium]
MSEQKKVDFGVEPKKIKARLADSSGTQIEFSSYQDLINHIRINKKTFQNEDNLAATKELIIELYNKAINEEKEEENKENSKHNSNKNNSSNEKSLTEISLHTYCDSAVRDDRQNTRDIAKQVVSLYLEFFILNVTRSKVKLMNYNWTVTADLKKLQEILGKNHLHVLQVFRYMSANDMCIYNNKSRFGSKQLDQNKDGSFLKKTINALVDDLELEDLVSLSRSIVGYKKKLIALERFKLLDILYKKFEKNQDNFAFFLSKIVVCGNLMECRNQAIKKEIGDNFNALQEPLDQVIKKLLEQCKEDNIAKFLEEKSEYVAILKRHKRLDDFLKGLYGNFKGTDSALLILKTYIEELVIGKKTVKKKEALKELFELLDRKNIQHWFVLLPHVAKVCNNVFEVEVDSYKDISSFLDNVVNQFIALAVHSEYNLGLIFKFFIKDGQEKTLNINFKTAFLLKMFRAIEKSKKPALQLSICKHLVHVISDTEFKEEKEGNNKQQQLSSDVISKVAKAIASGNINKENKKQWLLQLYNTYGKGDKEVEIKTGKQVLALLVKGEFLEKSDVKTIYKGDKNFDRLLKLFAYALTKEFFVENQMKALVDSVTSDQDVTNLLKAISLDRNNNKGYFYITKLELHIYQYKVNVLTQLHSKCDGTNRLKLVRADVYKKMQNLIGTDKKNIRTVYDAVDKTNLDSLLSLLPYVAKAFRYELESKNTNRKLTKKEGKSEEATFSNLVDDIFKHKDILSNNNCVKKFAAIENDNLKFQLLKRLYNQDKNSVLKIESLEAILKCKTAADEKNLDGIYEIAEVRGIGHLLLLLPKVVKVCGNMLQDNALLNKIINKIVAVCVKDINNLNALQTTFSNKKIVIHQSVKLEILLAILQKSAAAYNEAVTLLSSVLRVGNDDEQNKNDNNEAKFDNDSYKTLCTAIVAIGDKVLTQEKRHQLLEKLYESNRKNGAISTVILAAWLNNPLKRGGGMLSTGNSWSCSHLKSIFTLVEKDVEKICTILQKISSALFVTGDLPNSPCMLSNGAKNYLQEKFDGLIKELNNHSDKKIIGTVIETIAKQHKNNFEKKDKVVLLKSLYEAIRKPKNNNQQEEVKISLEKHLIFLPEVAKNCEYLLEKESVKNDNNKEEVKSEATLLGSLVNDIFNHAAILDNKNVDAFTAIEDDNLKFALLNRLYAKDAQTKFTTTLLEKVLDCNKPSKNKENLQAVYAVAKGRGMGHLLLLLPQIAEVFHHDLQENGGTTLLGKLTNKIAALCIEEKDGNTNIELLRKSLPTDQIGLHKKVKLEILLAVLQEKEFSDGYDTTVGILSSVLNAHNKDKEIKVDEDVYHQISVDIFEVEKKVFSQEKKHQLLQALYVKNKGKDSISIAILKEWRNNLVAKKELQVVYDVAKDRDIAHLLLLLPQVATVLNNNFVEKKDNTLLKTLTDNIVSLCAKEQNTTANLLKLEKTLLDSEIKIDQKVKLEILLSVLQKDGLSDVAYSKTVSLLHDVLNRENQKSANNNNESESKSDITALCEQIVATNNLTQEKKHQLLKVLYVKNKKHKDAGDILNEWFNNLVIASTKVLRVGYSDYLYEQQFKDVCTAVGNNVAGMCAVLQKVANLRFYLGKAKDSNLENKAVNELLQEPFKSLIDNVTPLNVTEIVKTVTAQTKHLNHNARLALLISLYNKINNAEQVEEVKNQKNIPVVKSLADNKNKILDEILVILKSIKRKETPDVSSMKDVEIKICTFLDSTPVYAVEEYKESLLSGNNNVFKIEKSNKEKDSLDSTVRTDLYLMLQQSYISMNSDGLTRFLDNSGASPDNLFETYKENFNRLLDLFVHAPSWLLEDDKVAFLKHSVDSVVKFGTLCAADFPRLSKQQLRSKLQAIKSDIAFVLLSKEKDSYRTEPKIAKHIDLKIKVLLPAKAPKASKVRKNTRVIVIGSNFRKDSLILTAKPKLQAEDISCLIEIFNILANGANVNKAKATLQNILKGFCNSSVLALASLKDEKFITSLGTLLSYVGEDAHKKLDSDIHRRVLLKLIDIVCNESSSSKKANKNNVEEKQTSAKSLLNIAASSIVELKKVDAKFVKTINTVLTNLEEKPKDNLFSSLLNAKHKNVKKLKRLLFILSKHNFDNLLKLFGQYPALYSSKVERNALVELATDKPKEPVFTNWMAYLQDENNEAKVSDYANALHKLAEGNKESLAALFKAHPDFYKDEVKRGKLLNTANKGTKKQLFTQLLADTQNNFEDFKDALYVLAEGSIESLTTLINTVSETYVDKEKEIKEFLHSEEKQKINDGKRKTLQIVDAFEKIYLKWAEVEKNNNENDQDNNQPECKKDKNLTNYLYELALAVATRKNYESVRKILKKLPELAKEITDAQRIDLLKRLYDIYGTQNQNSDAERNFADQLVEIVQQINDFSIIKNFARDYLFKSNVRTIFANNVFVSHLLITNCSNDQDKKDKFEILLHYAKRVGFDKLANFDGNNERKDNYKKDVLGKLCLLAIETKQFSITGDTTYSLIDLLYREVCDNQSVQKEYLSNVRDILAKEITADNKEEKKSVTDHLVEFVVRSKSAEQAGKLFAVLLNLYGDNLEDNISKKLYQVAHSAKDLLELFQSVPHFFYVDNDKISELLKKLCVVGAEEKGLTEAKQETFDSYARYLESNDLYQGLLDGNHNSQLKLLIKLDKDCNDSGIDERVKLFNDLLHACKNNDNDLANEKIDVIAVALYSQYSQENNEEQKLSLENKEIVRKLFTLLDQAEQIWHMTVHSSYVQVVGQPDLDQRKNKFYKSIHKILLSKENLRWFVGISKKDRTQEITDAISELQIEAEHKLLFTHDSFRQRFKNFMLILCGTLLVAAALYLLAAGIAGGALGVQLGCYFQTAFNWIGLGWQLNALVCGIGATIFGILIPMLMNWRVNVHNETDNDYLKKTKSYLYKNQIALGTEQIKDAVTNCKTPNPDTPNEL